MGPFFKNFKTPEMPVHPSVNTYHTKMISNDMGYKILFHKVVY